MYAKKPTDTIDKNAEKARFHDIRIYDTVRGIFEVTTGCGNKIAGKVEKATRLTSQQHHAHVRDQPCSSYRAHMFLQYVKLVTFRMMLLWTLHFALQNTYPHIRRPLCLFQTCSPAILGMVLQLFQIPQLSVERVVPDKLVYRTKWMHR